MNKGRVPFKLKSECILDAMDYLHLAKKKYNTWINNEMTSVLINLSSSVLKGTLLMCSGFCL